MSIREKQVNKMAACDDCDFEETGTLAIQAAKRHHNQTGHSVTWERHVSGVWGGDDGD